MKKSVIAVAVAALVASGATSAATVYDKDGTTLAIGGRVEAMLWSTHTGAGNDTYGDNTLSDRVRLNVRGSTKITDGITAYGFWEKNWEHRSSADKAGNNEDFRYAYVGVNFGQFGDIRFGRWEQALDWVTNVTDKIEEIGGASACFGDNRSSGQIGYEWNGYGVTAGLRYQTAINDSNEEDFVTKFSKNDGVDVDSGFGVYAGYTSPDVLFGPISFRTGYMYTKYQYKESEVDLGGPKNSQIFGVALSWGNHGKGPYIGLLYNYAKVKNNVWVYDVAEDTYTYGNTKAHGFEGMLSYGFDSGVVLSACYHYRKVKDEYADGNETTKMKYVSLIAAYNVNPNFRVWIEGHIDCDSDDGVSTYGYSTKYDADGDSYKKPENAYLIGVRYTF